MLNSQLSNRLTTVGNATLDASAFLSHQPAALSSGNAIEPLSKGRFFRASNSFAGVGRSSNQSLRAGGDTIGDGSSYVSSLSTSISNFVDAPLAPSAGVRVSVSDFIGNNTTSAYNIGDINNFNFTWNDSVNSGDVYDYFHFSVDNAATVNFSLTNLSADADIRLYNTAGSQLAVSLNGGSFNESISRFLATGSYYLRVESYLGASTNYRLNIAGAGPAADPGSLRTTALDLGNMNRGNRTWNDFVGSTDTNDYYRFELSENANFHLRLTGLSADADVQLFDRNGTLITSSTWGGNTSEAIDRFLSAGTYYARVYQWSGNTNYSLNLYTDTPSHFGTRTLAGSLRNDTFDFSGNFTRTVISGNGNVDYGLGLRDTLDLSSLLSTSVNFNLANTTTGGVLYNPGNGTRVFDSITLGDGREILFEGVDIIRFSDRTINLSVTPNDPLYNQQWNLHMMGTHNAWRFTTGSSNVLIGVQDTGLGTNADGSIHFDLRNTTIYANNYRDDYFRTFPGQGYGQKTTSHGTDVQGIIAAASNNGVGMTGINWNSTVFAIDVLDGNAGDQSLATATQNMINEANRNGQRLVINMSLGGGGIDPVFRALVAANQNNALFVISSGNANASTIGDPASLAREFGNVMAVGASWGRTDWNGNARTPGDRISYPGWWGSNYGTGLTLMAPSEVIATNAIRNSTTGSVSFGFDTRFNGTSAAAPNAAGVASLVWSANSSLTAVQVQQIMSQTAVDLGAPGYDTVTGSGMVNADAAVRRAIAIARGAVV